MVDMWETTGRLLTNDKLRGDLFTAFHPGSYRMNFARRAMIPMSHYDDARGIIAPSQKGPTSLMAIGEILYTISIDRNRGLMDKLAAALAATKVKVDPKNRPFLVALGAIIFDRPLRKQFAQQAYLHFSDLSKEDQDNLTAIAKDRAVDAAAKNFCDECWDDSCFCLTIPWAQHTHPVANPPQATNPPKGPHGPH
jgi:hypothetical protein